MNTNWDTNNSILHYNGKQQKLRLYFFFSFLKGQESWLEAGETTDFQQTEMILALKSGGLAKWWDMDNDNTRL